MPVVYCDVMLLSVLSTGMSYSDFFCEEGSLVDDTVERDQRMICPIVWVGADGIEKLIFNLRRFNPRILILLGNIHSDLMFPDGQRRAVGSANRNPLVDLIVGNGKRLEIVFFNSTASIHLANDLIRTSQGKIQAIGLDGSVDDTVTDCFVAAFLEAIFHEKDYKDAFDSGVEIIKELYPDGGVNRLHYMVATIDDDPAIENEYPIYLLGDIFSGRDDLILALKTQRVRGGSFGKERKEKSVSVSSHRSCYVHRDELCVEEKYVSFPLWFGTNRAPNDPDDISKGFGVRDDDRLYLGSCSVNIPKQRNPGDLGSYGWWKKLNDLSDDRLKLDTSALRILCADMLWAQVRQVLQERAIGERKTFLVFVHGYNTDFQEAAIRAAQLGWDLAIPGVTAFYSWPSSGRIMLSGIHPAYHADLRAIESAEKHMEDFFRQLLRQVGDADLHVIAHSMGNRGLLRVMNSLFGGSQKTHKKVFGQIFLAAADVDTNLFKNLARICSHISQRSTLYLSANDKPLLISKFIYGGYPRAGWKPPVTIIDGIDTVDATEVRQTFIGHSYFAEAGEQLKDISELIKNNTSPDERGLRTIHRPDGFIYWKLVSDEGS